MNALYKIKTELFKQLKEVGFNNIDFGDGNITDMHRQTIFPYVNIVPVSFDRDTEAGVGVTQYNFKILVLDRLDYGERKRDNLTDVLNDLLNMINRAVFNLEDVEIVRYMGDVVINDFKNRLGGYSIDLTAKVIDVVNEC